MIYCIAGTKKPTKSQLKKLPAYFKRAKLAKVTFHDVERLILQQRPSADLQKIMALVEKWE